MKLRFRIYFRPAGDNSPFTNSIVYNTDTWYYDENNSMLVMFVYYPMKPL